MKYMYCTVISLHCSVQCIYIFFGIVFYTVQPKQMLKAHPSPHSRNHFTLPISIILIYLYPIWIFTQSGPYNYPQFDHPPPLYTILDLFRIIFECLSLGTFFCSLTGKLDEDSVRADHQPHLLIMFCCQAEHFRTTKWCCFKVAVAQDFCKTINVL